MSRIVEQVNFNIPKPPKATRVAAYARVSSGKDSMLHSLSSQVSYYSEMIQSHPGWIYCGVYADEALTGTKEDRENFQCLLEQCRLGNIDMVITKSVSRFARNTVTTLETVRELKQIGIDIFFEEQNIHTKSADGELMLTILASYAQAESLSASENQKWRVQRAFENGELMNFRLMFGYSISKDGITINPSEAEIVREIFHRAIAGETLNSIAVDLNHRGVETTLGGKWTSIRIRTMLENEKYTGNALLMKRYRNNHLGKKLIKNKGERQQYYAEETHEAIIDEDNFYESAETSTENCRRIFCKVEPHAYCFYQLDNLRALRREVHTANKSWLPLLGLLSLYKKSRYMHKRTDT